MLTIDENHIYRWDGEVVPGVNEILGDMGIIQGQQFMTEESAAKGKRRHKVLEDWNEGILDWSTVAQEDYFYIMAWQEFCDDLGFVPQASEVQVYHPLWHYAGTLDVFGNDDEDDWILDVKTGGSIPRWTRLQLSLYREAFRTTDEKYAPKLGVVHLREAKKKPYAFKEVDYTPDALAIVASWQWANNKKEWIDERTG